MGEKTSDKSLELFSQRAIKKAVRKQILQTPIFLYPTAFGTLALLSLGVFGVSTTLGGIAATLLAAGVGSLGWQFGFRKNQMTRDYLGQMHASVNQKREKKRHDLSRRMEEMQFVQGIQQLEKLQEKFDNFVAILDRSLSGGELTYGRYLGIVEQVYLSSLDNLEQAVSSLESIRTIDTGEIDRRLHDIQADGIITDHETVEQDSLNKRRDLHEQQLDRVAALVAQNEQAMTRLDLTAAAIANIRTVSGQATMDMESAMTELQELIDRVHKYDIRN